MSARPVDAIQMMSEVAVVRTEEPVVDVSVQASPPWAVR